MMKVKLAEADISLLFVASKGEAWDLKPQTSCFRAGFLSYGWNLKPMLITLMSSLWHHQGYYFISNFGRLPAEPHMKQHVLQAESFWERNSPLISAITSPSVAQKLDESSCFLNNNIDDTISTEQKQVQSELPRYTGTDSWQPAAVETTW